MRIAKAEYYWPSKEEQSTLPFPISKNAQRLTDSLLQRDPSRRASLEAVWEHDEWLNGGPAKIETRDWAGQVWHHDDDKNEVLCAEVEPL